MSKHADDWTAQRAEMVRSQLEARGVRDAKVLAAMGDIPREIFLPKRYRDRAYLDGAQNIDCGQTISQPYMVGRMTELLEPRRTARVLEIGTGCGYQTAILARLCDHVYTVEWHQELSDQARARLDGLGVTNVTYRCGDGSTGWLEHAPYDAIMVTAGAPDVPAPLRDQLADGGCLVLPIGPAGDQTLVVVWRLGDEFRQIDILKCRFVKLVGAAGWNA
jgi:protein-L-isoaspartate(D-aspartate) O-methyltransferase